VVDLAGAYQVIPLPTADVDAVPVVAVEGEAGDGKRLAPRAGFLHPIAAAPRWIAAVADLGDDAFKADLAGVREHLLAVDLEAFAELDVGAVDDLPQMRLALDQRQLSKVRAMR
jgi:hypothetical protein